MENGSLRTVLLALAANAGITVAKFVAAAITGSSSMLAEALHSLSDTGNEVLLLVAHRRSTKPATAERPLGHGREAYFWAMLAAVGVFVTGAVLSISHGFSELLNPTPTSDYLVAYVVLGVATVLEGASWVQSYQQLRTEGSRRNRDVLTEVQLTSDPMLRAVFAEDAAAVVGNVIAITGVALHQSTGSVVPDAIASILIGLLLAYVAFFLGRRNRDYIVGEAISPQTSEVIVREIESIPGVVSVRDAIATFIGPHQVWVIARIDVDDSMTGRDVEQLVRRAEKQVLDLSDALVRADIVPVG